MLNEQDAKTKAHGAPANEDTLLLFTGNWIAPLHTLDIVLWYAPDVESTKLSKHDNPQ